MLNDILPNNKKLSPDSGDSFYMFINYLYSIYQYMDMIILLQFLQLLHYHLKY